MAKGTTVHTWEIKAGDVIRRMVTSRWLIVFNVWNQGPEKRRIHYFECQSDEDGWRVDPRRRAISSMNCEEWHIPINEEW